MGHTSLWHMLMMVIYWMRKCKENAEASLLTSKDIRLKVNTEKTIHTFICKQNAMQNHYLNRAIKTFKNVANLNIWKRH
jgi:hypothetical protein